MPNYLTTAAAEISVVVQVETVKGSKNLEAIANVDGVDGVFFGPADLSASMDLLGKPDYPVVREPIRAGVKLTLAAKKAADGLAPNPAFVKECLEAGAPFVAVGTDIGLLSLGVAQWAAAYEKSESSLQNEERVVTEKRC